MSNGKTSSFIYEIARTPETLAVAEALVTRIYADEGYLDAASTERSAIAKFLGTQGAVTFIAHANGSIVGTITVVMDGTIGIPMDSLYRDVLAPLREGGLRIAEVCQFAIDKTSLCVRDDDSDVRVRELGMSTTLFGHTIRLALDAQIHRLCFTINPKHRRFYSAIGAVEIGEERSYASVNGAPALAFALDMEVVRAIIKDGAQGNLLLRKIIETMPASGGFIPSFAGAELTAGRTET